VERYYVREVLRGNISCFYSVALCHSILFHRCFAVIRPMDAEIESLSLSHAKVPDSDIEKLIETKCKELTNDLSQQVLFKVIQRPFMSSYTFPFIKNKNLGF
jgi:hypothetical protein